MATETPDSKTRTEDDVVDLREEGSDRGRGAQKPRELGAKGWKDVALRVKDELKTDHVPLLSAGVAFYLLLALFPALAAMVSVYGLVADPEQVSQQVEDISSALPEGAQDLVTEQLEGIVSSSGSGIGFALAAGVLASLWTASSGVKHLITAINAAFDEPEGRGFLKLRGLALLLTLGALVFGVVAVGVITGLPAVLSAVDLGQAAETAITIATYPLLAVVFGIALSILYRYSPDRERAQWRWVSVGAVVATVVWIAASIGFTVYVSNFGSYGETYGSIGAVIVLMLWLVITAFAIILGAEVDSETEAQTARDSTDGAPEPMGERGAVKADELGAARS